jgi:hypothetical protein
VLIGHIEHCILERRRPRYFAPEGARSLYAVPAPIARRCMMFLSVADTILFTFCTLISASFFQLIVSTRASIHSSAAQALRDSDRMRQQPRAPFEGIHRVSRLLGGGGDARHVAHNSVSQHAEDTWSQAAPRTPSTRLQLGWVRSQAGGGTRTAAQPTHQQSERGRPSPSSPPCCEPCGTATPSSAGCTWQPSAGSGSLHAATHRATHTHTHSVAPTSTAQRAP